MVLGTVAVFALAILVVVVAIVLSVNATHVVAEDEVEALVVFGDIQGVLLPGKHYIPPFFSETHPVDRESMSIEREGERLSLPEDCVELIEKHEESEERTKSSGRRSD